jgi:hypothetical protein
MALIVCLGATATAHSATQAKATFAVLLFDWLLTLAAHDLSLLWPHLAHAPILFWATRYALLSPRRRRAALALWLAVFGFVNSRVISRHECLALITASVALCTARRVYLAILTLVANHKPSLLLPLLARLVGSLNTSRALGAEHSPPISSPLTPSPPTCNALRATSADDSAGHHPTDLIPLTPSPFTVARCTSGGPTPALALSTEHSPPVSSHLTPAPPTAGLCASGGCHTRGPASDLEREVGSAIGCTDGARSKRRPEAGNASKCPGHTPEPSCPALVLLDQPSPALAARRREALARLEQRWMVRWPRATELAAALCGAERVAMPHDCEPAAPPQRHNCEAATPQRHDYDSATPQRVRRPGPEAQGTGREQQSQARALVAHEAAGPSQAHTSEADAAAAPSGGAWEIVSEVEAQSGSEGMLPRSGVHSTADAPQANVGFGAGAGSGDPLAASDDASHNASGAWAQSEERTGGGGSPSHAKTEGGLVGEGAESDAAHNASLLCAISRKAQARFHVSGSEALSTAVLLARLNTGRPMLLVFGGNAHGWTDGVAQVRHSPLMGSGGGVAARSAQHWAADAARVWGQRARMDGRGRSGEPCSVYGVGGLSHACDVITARDMSSLPSPLTHPLDLWQSQEASHWAKSVTHATSAPLGT